jgi:DNA-binding MarR family transcriptional regulator
MRNKYQPAMTKPPRLIFLLNSAQRRLQQWISTQQAHETAVSGATPTAAQGGALFVLSRQDGATMSEIASALDLAPSAVSGLIQRLETLGWVARQPCPQDGRTQRVWLQSAGREQLAPLRQALTHINARLTKGFTNEELHTVARWLRHVQQLDPSLLPATRDDTPHRAHP